MTKGFEDSLYDEKKEFRLKGFIRPEMIVGIEEEVDEQGRVIREVDENQVIDAADHLLDAGARVIVVSFLRSAVNPGNERKVKEIINLEYPPHYLGSVIVLLTSEVSARPVEYQRTNTAVLNSYIHADLVRYLYKGDEELSRRGSLRPMLVVHSTGGMATVAKTTALNTYNSGPSAGA